MKKTPKVLLATMVFGIFSLASIANKTIIKTPDYTVKKDSSVTSTPVDTNKKTITFPSPFNVFFVGEEKSQKR